MASNAGSDVDTEEEKTMNGGPSALSGRAAEYADFAIIWSFLENFGRLLHFPKISLETLEHAFDSQSRTNESVQILEELHRKLLRRLGISVQPEKWQRALLKVAKEQSLACVWDLEQFGYAELPVASRLEIFKVLLECQFDQNDRFKTAVNKSHESFALRKDPIGRDQDGLIYWYHEDDSNGLRLYSTEEDELGTESWRLLAADVEALAAIIEYLETTSRVNPKEVALVRWEEQKKEKAKEKKKRRKGKKKVEADPDDDGNPCARCYSNVRPESILLCDKCDAAYHTACLRPPLLTVPKGDWFCPYCQQIFLLETLQEKKARQDLRKKLRQRQAKRLNCNGINLSNILQKESDEEDEGGIRRSGRARKTVDYTFRDFDEDINEAVDKDRKRFKPGEGLGLNGCDPTPMPRPQRDAHGTRRSRRLRDLDEQSDTESRTSEFEYQGSSDEDGPTHPPRHVYLRRNVLNDEDDEEDGKECKENCEGEGAEEGGAGGKESRNENTGESQRDKEEEGQAGSVDCGHSKPSVTSQLETRTSLEASPATPVPPGDCRPQPVANAHLEGGRRDAPSPLSDLSMYLTPDMCNKEEMFPEIPVDPSQKDEFPSNLAGGPAPVEQGQGGFPSVNSGIRTGYGLPGPPPTWTANAQYGSGAYGRPGYSSPGARLPSSPGQRNPATGFPPPVPNSPGGLPAAVPNSPGSARTYPPPSYSQTMAAYSAERTQYSGYPPQPYAQSGVTPAFFPAQQTANQSRDSSYYGQRPPPPSYAAANRPSYPASTTRGAAPTSAPWTLPEGGIFYPGAGVGADAMGQKFS